ncbi:uncharacterized protein LOC113118006 [Carassius auratus]|uniref:Uncharacterized protein LOC113118006 n=1 Tax=Carassius auratus TaxID=7957 RepID=A0A6P6RBX8_CARAU|nr:uncharacterized protein LOC113118006 [Carassius auratus]
MKAPEGAMRTAVLSAAVLRGTAIGERTKAAKKDKRGQSAREEEQEGEELPGTAADGDTKEGLQEPDRDGVQHTACDNDHFVRTTSHISTRTRKVLILLSRALLLVSLLHLYSQSVECESVDINTLHEITRFFHQNYEIGQYAVAINVPEDQCKKGFKPSTFLREDRNVDVKNIISAHTNPVYEGRELIAAGVQTTPNPAHSEFLLMNPPNKSPLTRLLNKRKNGCVVFYTLNTPCMNTCLNDRSKFNIIGGLNKLKNYMGIKAFAFKNIWNHDQNRTNELREKLQMIANRIPLYRCNSDICTLCGEPQSNIEINDGCLND